MATYRLISSDVEQTIAIGRTLGQCLPKGTFVALNGILGAGKTHLVKGVALGLGEGGWAGLRSPTFTLMLSYHGGRAPLHHADFYRLNEAPELPGEIEEAMHAKNSVCVVEWADILPEVWPERYIRIDMEILEDGRRSIVIEDATEICPDQGEKLAAWLEDADEPDHDTIS